MIENKFPGKDITTEDLKTKFPLCKKKNKSHKTIINIDGLSLGKKRFLSSQVLIWLRVIS